MILLAVVLVFAATALGVTVLLGLLVPAPSPHVVRLRQMGMAAGASEPAQSTFGTSHRRLATRAYRIAEWLGRVLVAQNPKKQSRWGKLLIQAGYRNPNAIFALQGLRVLLAALLPVLFLLIAPHFRELSGAHILAATVGLVAAGLFLPHWRLMRRIERRRDQISDALPNALDLMVVCSEAGLGLDATIHRLAQETQFTKQALSEEFEIVGQETRAGRPRSEALLAMKDRIGLAEVSSLVLTLVQAEKMGTGIARSLRVYADSLRTQRRQRAEERAAKIPVKMVFPLVLLIFPATLLVLLGPSYILIYKALAAMKR